jgi:signal recognition particle subunit SRP54
MVLEKLGRAIHSALQKVARSPHVDERVIKDLVRDIQRALLQADVNVRLVLSLSKRIEQRALEEKPPPGVDKRAHIMRIVYEELSEFLGKPGKFVLEPGKTKVLMMVGLQGSGKTTSVAKLANYYGKRGFRVGVVCADTYRPGAYEQLLQLGEQAGFRVFGDPNSSDAVDVARRGVEHFRELKCELIIVDTAGRHKNEEELMREMKELADKVKPDEVMLVVDGTIGQQAKAQAEAFNAATALGSIMVTKLDGTAKGGGALSAVAATGASIKFVGTGEHLDDIEPYDPARFLARLLGLGDLETLLKKMEEVFSKEKIRVPEKKDLLTGRITLKDVYDQLEALSKMGPLKKVLQMLPGIGVSIPEEQFRIGEEKLKKFKVIMQSMTPQELENPKILNTSRIRRIARGSGTSEADVRELLKQYELMQKLLKSLLRGRIPKMGPWSKLLRKIGG